jgi:ribonuclease P protein component
MVSVCGCEPAPAAPLFRPGVVRAAPGCPPEGWSIDAMLPRSLRMRSSKDFRQTTRRGVRVSRPTLVVHAAHLDQGRFDQGHLKEGKVDDGNRIGLVVSGAVGNAVTRNRVKRRLRHLAAAHVAYAPAGIGVVVRALPRAVTEPAEVPTDFGSAWQEAMSRLGRASVGMKHGVR